MIQEDSDYALSREAVAWLRRRVGLSAARAALIAALAGLGAQR